MFTGLAGRFIWAAAVVFFGYLNSSSFASDEAKSLAKALSQVKLFAALTDAEREVLKTTATVRRVRAGERIIEQGKRSGKMFIVLDGQAEVWGNEKRIVA